jgi:hypothetical protein
LTAPGAAAHDAVVRVKLQTPEQAEVVFEE